jgi:hypothetical protein
MVVLCGARIYVRCAGGSTCIGALSSSLFNPFAAHNYSFDSQDRMSLLRCGVITDIKGPEAFAVCNGKLYLCGNQGAVKSFKSNIDSNTEKADTNWRQLNGS